MGKAGWGKRRRNGITGEGTRKSLVVYHLQWYVKGLGKWSAKFRTGEFRPRTAFIIFTNQFHLPRNGLECLKLVSKMALKK